MNLKKPQSTENKQIARHVVATFGGPPIVLRFAVEKEGLSLDVVGSVDRPRAGVNAYSTVGSSDYPENREPGELTPRAEIYGICTADKVMFPNILASVAIRAIQDGRALKIGEAIRDAVGIVYPKSSVPHLFLAEPVLWTDRLAMLECGAKKVTWLLAVPASDRELEFLARQTESERQKFLQDRQADLANLARGLWFR